MIRFQNIVIDRQRLTISVGERTYQFRHGKLPHSMSHLENYTFAACCHLLLNGWTSKDQLFDFIFGKLPNGGPDSGLLGLSVQIVHWNKKMKSIGLRIVGDRRAGVTWYKIEEIDGRPYARRSYRVDDSGGGRVDDADRPVGKAR